MTMRCQAREKAASTMNRTRLVLGPMILCYNGHRYCRTSNYGRISVTPVYLEITEDFLYSKWLGGSECPVLNSVVKLRKSEAI